MNLAKLLCLLPLLFPLFLTAQTTGVNLEETASFYPDETEVNDVNWSFLQVPENWEQPDGKKIKLAVAILKRTGDSADPNPMVYIEGGPGAGGIPAMWYFYNHPIRENNDLIFIDIRGTGFSEPRLCPDLGKKFFEILAADQTPEEDEAQKALAALACKQDLIGRDIDIHAYHSKAIAKDLHALREALAYPAWNVYGISYGTQVAQVYAEQFPADIKTLILDSAIPEIGKYYTQNTSNYMQGLRKIFDKCKNDPDCNRDYPDLEQKYFATIEQLRKKPITVKVDENTIRSGTFTYNPEDFKVAIQQALYRKRLIEVLPLLITEFHNGNESTLSALVSAFAGALGLDYGVYYCMTCEEVMPYNAIDNFAQDARQYPKLQGGLSFYKSDFLVCDKWNRGEQMPQPATADTFRQSSLTAPVLIFSGEFDPITPSTNGGLTKAKFPNSSLIEAPRFGHGPGISISGFKALQDFMAQPTQAPDNGFLANTKVAFANDIKISGGVSHFANSLDRFDPLFFVPLLTAVLILLIAIAFYVFSLIRNRTDSRANKGMKLLMVLMGLVGLFSLAGFAQAVSATATQNFYVLAFGLPGTFNYLFILQWLFVGLVASASVYFLVSVRKLSNRGILSSVLFSGMLISVYYYYWGFLG